MRVLFWGTPDFAAPALRALLGEGFDVVAVVTQPDRPVGRSRSTLQPSPVKRIAMEEGVLVLQPEHPRGNDFVAALTALAPDLSIVVAYGHILPRAVIDLPARGTINIHASLLPKLRGAAPIQAAIRDGHVETGITIMRMVPRLDAGPILVQSATPILDDETYGELALRLSEQGALTLIETLSLMELGHAPEAEQDETEATYAAKIERNTTRVDWSRDARMVGRGIRAFDPRPGAFSTLRGAELKLFGARSAPRTEQSAPGEVIDASTEGLIVACGEGAVRITAVQPAGKRRLSPDEWARGRGVAIGDRFDVITGAA